MTGKVLCLCGLAIIGWFDLKDRMIPMLLLIANIICATGFQVLVGRKNICLILGGACIGILFLLISALTKEAVGYGDGLGILGIGIYHGLWDTLEILMVTFGVLFFVSIFVLVYKKMSKKTEIPFYPFLVMGYGLWCI